MATSPRDDLADPAATPVSDPLGAFRRWLDEAVAAGLPEPNAMNLVTLGTDSRPSSRIVLLKACDARGFVFYTNYLSRKGQELAASAAAALNFFWPQLARQVRVEGQVHRVDAAESDAYFASRPRGSQIGAWTSLQSRPVDDRETIERRFAELSASFEGREVPRPPHWGGYVLSPDRIEFWHGRESRLHDRILYRLGDGGAWTGERLWP